MPKNLQGDPFPEIALFLRGYNLSIPRFQPNNMLVFIADTCNSVPGTEIDDITGFLGFSFLPIRWRGKWKIERAD